ncbi:MAG: proline iminopeptidase-family hydrolase [Gemmatimonadales bacterium]
MRLLTTSLAAVTLLLVACATKDTSATADGTASTASQDVATPAVAPLAEGEARFAIGGNDIWYKKSGSGSGIPVILLHGGPGFNSYYLKPLEALGDERPVIRYDQGGAGKSGTMTDTTKMNIPYFVAELDSLRAHLGYDKVHLVGHSWGTIVALEYYRAHPEHVASLTLASAALDVPQWERHAGELLKTLPGSIQRIVKAREAEKKFDSPDYQSAIESFYGKYVWLRPDKPNLDSLMSQVNQDIYTYMQGPSEFTITGTLKNYNSTSFLKNVKVPTLFTVGDVDEADPVTIRKQAAMVPGGEVFVIPNAAHMSTWDNPTAMIAVIRAHLKAADSSRMK